MSDEATIAQLLERFTDEIRTVASEKELQAVRDRYLGRKSGAVTLLFADVAKATADRKRQLGRLVNELKTRIETEIDARRDSVAAQKAPSTIDVTLPGRDIGPGHRHPLTVIRERVEAIFARMGFDILDGPETEDDFHNFEALNMPADHPARDAQDTLYLSQPLDRRVWPVSERPAHTEVDTREPATLLRTHTSPMQIRYMRTHEPPVRIIAPGRVYRRDNLDVTHTPMFQQVEGLVVGEGISLGDLKGTLVRFLRQFFDENTRILFKPSFFPYTEPSADVLIGCSCDGVGCSVCKRTGWLEILGSGMVHPRVFEAVGYDPERYTGFAFGMGIERVAMLRYGVEDIRAFYENDLRFLEQFPL